MAELFGKDKIFLKKRKNFCSAVNLFSAGGVLMT